MKETHYHRKRRGKEKTTLTQQKRTAASGLEGERISKEEEARADPMHTARTNLNSAFLEQTVYFQETSNSLQAPFLKRTTCRTLERGIWRNHSAGRQGESQSVPEG